MPAPVVLPNAAMQAYAEALRRIEPGPLQPKDDSAQPAFKDLLQQNLANAVDAGRQSEAVSLKAAGGQASLQDVVEAVTAAELTLQTVVSIRDRVISAYQEIMRMPI